jgi:hypothetical protein
MTDPIDPKRDDEPLPADQSSGAGYGNNSEEDEGGGDGAEGRPSEL